MSNKKVIALLALFMPLFAIQSKSQTKDPIVNIQSPNVATLGLFGEYPVSYFTGIPQINVPIYTLKDKDISLPISLNYHASGVRPDMHPGWVGLNWNLNAGGIISRLVHGKRADEFNNPNINNGANAGYYYQHNLLNVSNWNDVAYMKSVEEQNLYGVNDENENLDTEPDEFNFSFLNYSGKFMLGADGNWKVKCDKPLKVIFNTSPLLSVPFETLLDGNSQTFSGFTIITEDGTKYIFGNTTNAIEYCVNFFYQYGEWTANSWYLTQIISSNNVTTASFTYEPDSWISQIYSSIGSYSFYTTDTDPIIANKVACDGGSDIKNAYSYAGVLIRPVYLKSIQTSNYNCVFNRLTSTELRYDQTVYDGSKTLGGSFPHETLPWLEFNSVSAPYPQTDPYPACLANLQWKKLTQININKKDGTLIKGFNFTYNNNPYERLMLTSLSEFGNDQVANPPYLFSYVQPASHNLALPPYLAEETDHYGFYNGTFAYVGENNSGITPAQYAVYRQPNPAYLQVGTLNKIVYPTGGITDFMYEANDYSKQLNLIRSSGYTDFGATSSTGGLRIRKISSYDPTVANPKLEKEYFYVNNYDHTYTSGSIGFVSSGVLGAQVQYGFTNQEVVSKPSATYYQNYFSTQTVLPGSINSQGSPVTYSQVVEKSGDGSYTKYFFTNFDNGYLDEITTSIQPIQTAYAPFSSNEEERGKPQTIEIHNANDVIVKSDVFSYLAVNKATDFVPALHGQSFSICGSTSPAFIDEGNAYKIYTYSFLPSQNKETTFDLNGLNPVTVVKNYYYDNLVHKQVTRSEIIDSKNQSQVVISSFPGDMVNLGQSVPYQEMVDRNIVSPVVQQTVQLNGVAESKFITSYAKDPATALILPAAFQTQTLSNPIETRASFLNYDPSGNILSTTSDNKSAVNYVWSFYGLYPIAKIENSNYATVTAVLGGTAVINAFTNSSPSIAAISSFLSPLRTDPRMQNAFVTTYNYLPGTGMASLTDPNGKSTSFEYDNFARLINVKDLNGYITNHYSYHFSGLVPITPVIYKSVSKSGYFYGLCGDPPAWTQPSRPVIYTVPAGAYSSTMSQADADQQAQNDVNSNGQSYANANPTCY